MSSLQLIRCRCRASKLLEKRALRPRLRRDRRSSLLTPLLLVVALLIKLDSPGPVFFLQRRYGFNQQPFRIFKFRTMRTLDDGAVIQSGDTRRSAR